jgi:hypothetical protein
MPEQHAKRAILSALQREADFSGLAGLPEMGSGEGRNLLQWLDQSGLALTFLKRLQTREATPLVTAEFRYALGQRLARNVERLRDMLEEFQRINQAFCAQDVPAATLKGFTLVPDFCEDACLRHQADFDFLVDPVHVEAAAAALQSCGYSTARLSKSAESCFTTPLLHIPSHRDDLYVLQKHRQVDLHTSIAENSSWIPLEVPHDCLANMCPVTLYGVHFYGLSLEDKFLVQVFHAFRHSFRSWIRLSWLLEIGRCMELHEGNVALWERVIGRAGKNPLTKRIFVFVLGLTNHLFQSPIPGPLQTWSAEAVTPSMRAWIDHFSVAWGISDWPGSLNNLFLTPDFISGRKLRRQYLKSRLLPRKAQISIDPAARNSRSISLKLKSAQLRYVAHRTAAHLKDILCFPLEQIRWKRALAAARASALNSEC